MATEPTWVQPPGTLSPYFTFAASAAGVPTHAAPPVETIRPPDPGYHIHVGGPLDLIIMTSAFALVAYHVRLSRQRPRRR